MIEHLTLEINSEHAKCASRNSNIEPLTGFDPPHRDTTNIEPLTGFDPRTSHFYKY